MTEFSEMQRRLAIENVARIKAQRAAGLLPPKPGAARQERRNLKRLYRAKPLGASLVDLTKPDSADLSTRRQ